MGERGAAGQQLEEDTCVRVCLLHLRVRTLESVFVAHEEEERVDT